MTNSCKRWPEWLLKQATAPPPEGCEGLIVPDSTPVVSFGDPVRATVATISLNPSKQEFPDRGLVTLSSLDVPNYESLNCDHGARILDGCANYFKGKPFDWFFLPLDCILRAGARASYYADARPDARYLDLACHLDLSPWATIAPWRKLTESDSESQKKLQSQGIHFLREHICYGQYSLVLVNGIGATNAIGGNLVEWTPVSHAEDPQSVKFYKARHFDTLFLAWNCFIQYELKHLPALTRFVARCYDEFLNQRRTT